jgi:hypothetical protein
MSLVFSELKDYPFDFGDEPVYSANHELGLFGKWRAVQTKSAETLYIYVNYNRLSMRLRNIVMASF